MPQRLVAASAFPLTDSIKSSEQVLEEVLRRERRPTSEECPFCADAPVKENGSKCVGVCRNPQNVPGPLIFPHEMQTAEDAVRLQLNAMRDNNVPRANHGVQVLYEYAVEAGQMERSWYFGWSTDVYHFDHFLGKALGSFGSDFIDCRSYEISPAQLMPDGRTRVQVQVENQVGQKSNWTFVMVVRTFSKYKGCWATHRLMRSDSPHLDRV